MSIRIDVISPFPQLVEAVVRESILGRAEKAGAVTYNLLNLFDFADPPYHQIDDTPFGGGSGMILKPEPVFRAVDKILDSVKEQPPPRVVFPTPDGRPFTEGDARKLSDESHLIFICGHYKGIDQRIRDHLVTDEYSIGDFVVTGGELPALLIIDAVVRLIPGVLGSFESAETDSFTSELLDGPHYTRPRQYRGVDVPDVLLSGNHQKIATWRRERREAHTKSQRPDLWTKYLAEEGEEMENKDG